MSSFGCVLFTVFATNIFCSIVDGSSYLNKLVLKSSLKDVQNPGICSQEARCEPIQNYTCFGTTLPYSSTSIALADDSISQFEIQENLALWQGLRSVPRCWAVVQPLLCSVYMPKCENQSLLLPSQEMCRIMRARCRAVEVQHGWPPFLQCENKKLFPPGCRNPLQEVKFNTTFKCIRPLVETDNPDRWYEDVEGCGLQCQDPLFSEDEHQQIHNFIKTLAIISFCANLVTVLTFVISWKVSNRYPAVIICYINACLLVASCGWLIQLIPGAKEQIICREDGTRRRIGESRPSSSPAHLCNFTFILIYAPSIAAIICFVILTYAWYVLFRRSGVPEGVGKIWQWRNLFALFVPVVLTMIVFYLDAIESDSVSGVCFVASSTSSRSWFLLLPTTLAAILGGVFLAGAILALINLKKTSEELANAQMKKQIRCMIIRIGIFSFFSTFFVVSAIVCHIYEFVYREEWEKYLREYIVCLATASVTHVSCTLRHHPNIYILQLRLFSLFGFCILMASWAWTPATVELWKQVFYRCCRSKKKDDSTTKKHQIIAKAFPNKQDMNERRLSSSIVSMQKDPIGMNLDMNSIPSRDITTSCVAAFPKFLNCHNAVAAVDPLRLPQQYSSASDVSIQRISLDSFHQQTHDSLSQESAHDWRQRRRKTRRERKRFETANHIAALYSHNRRGSDTSLQSSIIAASVAAAVAKASGGKVTQATSTGDLNNVVGALFPHFPAPCIVNRPHTQRPVVPNLPFTHGMTDYSHTMNANTRTGAASVAQSLNLGFKPNSTAQSPFAALYNQAYGFMPQLPVGYLPSAMYQSLLPGYLQMMAGNVDCSTTAYDPLNYFPYGQFTVPTSVENPTQTPLIPLHPTLDSSSETEYFPIVLSDSEFTDGGHRSYDEAQFLSAQRFLQKQASAQTVSSRGYHVQPRPVLEPQSCAKTQFLKKIEATTQSFQPKNISMEDKLSYSEAPPPSPANSDQEDPTEGHCLNGKGKLPKTLSRESLKSVEAFLAKVGDAFSGVKSRIKRASSVPHGIVDDDDVELNLKTSRVSLRCASNSRTGKDSNCEETCMSLLQHPNNVNIKSNNIKAPGFFRTASENVSR